MSVSFVYVCKYLQRTVPGLVAEFFELVKGAGRGHNAGRGEPGSPAARGVETAASWASCGFDRGAGCGTNYSQQSTIFSTKIVRGAQFFARPHGLGGDAGLTQRRPPSSLGPRGTMPLEQRPREALIARGHRIFAALRAKRAQQMVANSNSNLHTQSSCPTSPRADTDNKTQEKMGSLENRVKQEFGSAK